MRKKILCCLASLLAVTPSHAWSGDPTPGKTVNLVPDSCPVVSKGDSIALDWNPGFDHPSVVVGLDRFSLEFSRVGSDGIVRIPHGMFEIRGIGQSLSADSIGNGYFHIELKLNRRMPPGVYRVVGAASIGKTIPEYSGPLLTMTNSPTRERFCITISGPSTAPSASSSSGG